MKKKIILAFSVLMLLVVGIYLLETREVTPKAKEETAQQSTKVGEKEEAIRQAQEYRTDQICTQALVPAVHRATGAKYTFPSGCLAPGWEPDL